MTSRTRGGHYRWANEDPGGYSKVNKISTNLVPTVVQPCYRIHYHIQCHLELTCLVDKPAGADCWPWAICLWKYSGEPSKRIKHSTCVSTIVSHQWDRPISIIKTIPKCYLLLPAIHCQNISMTMRKYLCKNLYVMKLFGINKKYQTCLLRAQGTISTHVNMKYTT